MMNTAKTLKLPACRQAGGMLYDNRIISKFKGKT
jgi:hypothetical protein